MGGDDIIGLFQELFSFHGRVVWELFDDLLIELLKGNLHDEVYLSFWFVCCFWQLREVQNGVKDG